MHRIKWIVQDACGNETICNHNFTIQQGTSSIKTLENEDFTLLQNEPNPFDQNTAIGFRLPRAAEASLTLYDAAGRLLYHKTDYFGQGYNTVQIEGGWLHSPGILYYKLESGSKVAWRKMMLLRG